MRRFFGLCNYYCFALLLDARAVRVKQEKTNNTTTVHTIYYYSSLLALFSSY